MASDVSKGSGGSLSNSGSRSSSSGNLPSSGVGGLSRSGDISTDSIGSSPSHYDMSVEGSGRVLSSRNLESNREPRYICFCDRCKGEHKHKSSIINRHVIELFGPVVGDPRDLEPSEEIGINYPCYCNSCKGEAWQTRAIIHQHLLELFGPWTCNAILRCQMTLDQKIVQLLGLHLVAQPHQYLHPHNRISIDEATL
jgi:hypothetical protein